MKTNDFPLTIVYKCNNNGDLELIEKIVGEDGICEVFFEEDSRGKFISINMKNITKCEGVIIEVKTKLGISPFRKSY